MRQNMTLILAVLFCSTSTLAANDWPHWRGPEQNGISRETGIVDTFDLETMDNVKWVSKIGGRGTPIVLNGKVYLNCRTSENTGIDEELLRVQDRSFAGMRKLEKNFGRTASTFSELTFPLSEWVGPTWSAIQKRVMSTSILSVGFFAVTPATEKSFGKFR